MTDHPTEQAAAKSLAQSDKGLPLAEWSIMFVDLIDSTQMKYDLGENAGTFAVLIGEFFEAIRGHSQGHEVIKFTGDGAMVVWRANCNAQGINAGNGPARAIRAAEQILLQAERMNLSFRFPRFHIRIGITTGMAHSIGGNISTELSGQAVDLASRLCAEAGTDNILADDRTKSASGVQPHCFSECKKRLSLRGVPPLKPDRFWFYEARRLVHHRKQDPFKKGLLALYPDRAAVQSDFSPTRLLHLAANNTEILVAGRTLIGWTNFEKEIACIAQKKNITFKFLISSRKACEVLDPVQQQAIDRDLKAATAHFQYLAATLNGKFQIRESSQIVLDGITCATIRLPHSGDQDRLMVLQDINAAPGDDKSAALWMCRCLKPRDHDHKICMAGGLYQRTALMFDKSDPIPAKRALHIFEQFTEGSDTRHNRLQHYLHTMEPCFKHIADPTAHAITPPICVQVQISSSCSTHCTMCDHWKDKPHPSALTKDEWIRLFRELAAMRVQSLIFSGGEPLECPDFCELAAEARRLGLRVGLLTSGSGRLLDSSFETVVATINEHFDWVSVSIDGAEIEDQKIRLPDFRLSTAGRGPSLDRFCKAIRQCDAAKRTGVRLSATVTLQRENSGMDLRGACDFIRNLGIPSVNFKLATGARQALGREPRFLIDETSLRELNDFLWQDDLSYHKDELTKHKVNNLDYLRRSIAAGTFDVVDAAEGAPIRSFYKRNKLRCFTPYVFALVDGDGSVFPCCHLFRDNHSRDPRTEGPNGYRQRLRLGYVRDSGGFGGVWAGGKYQSLRDELKTIDPVGNERFLPCGECTRHCQHNHALTHSFEAWQKDPARFFAELGDRPLSEASDSTTWF